LILVASAVGGAAPAQAQNFFERLFGIGQRQGAPSAPSAPAAPEAPADAPKARPVAPGPVQARPVSLRVPPEDAVFGKDLKQNGVAGSLRIDRAGGAVKARLSLIGRRPQAVDSCTIPLEGNLVSEGRVEGLSRYKLSTPDCTFTLDVFDDAVLVKGSGSACQFTAANCQADPSGLWGPEPGALLTRARDFETARASADKAVRENYKALVQRARPEAVRPIVAEQAAFSSDREITCRSYAREAQHSFCNARFSEGRAIALAQRLGVTMASAQPGASAPQPGPGPGRVRVREQAGSDSAVPDQRDPYAVPSTSELVERNPFDD